MIYDISIPIDANLPVWDGDPPISVERVMRMEAGDAYNLTRLEISAHTGTHVDAPLHFVPGGGAVESLALGALTGPARVVEFDLEGDIGAAHLEAAAIPPGTQRLIFKTRNSRLWEQRPTPFVTTFSGVAEDGARWLVERGVRLVGIDYLSIEGYASVEAGSPVHRILLGAGVVVLEGLDLRAVPPGAYDLFCLPVKISGADGAPARAILVS